ncbi:MAG: hypothetical protein K5912_02985 [Alphaproteobacteria bacterium]|nr:hypothetical protein [Alphaproteobacteria bacterium]
MSVNVYDIDFAKLSEMNKESLFGGKNVTLPVRSCNGRPIQENIEFDSWLAHETVYNYSENVQIYGGKHAARIIVYNNPDGKRMLSMGVRGGIGEINDLNAALASLDKKTRADFWSRFNKYKRKFDEYTKLTQELKK